ncbi:hypothetical protein QBC35DRAFT_494614 [Podospora australis]|uniref:Mid2 domain-containing protein n=1 Tax=Podospora australis TaxID=1536484 RepID=A0AAN6WWZ4_9PEZI|nr:hypothetical protein QBC35DRAFT_494614 [Podospora australis]
MVKPLSAAALFTFSYLYTSCLAASDRQCFFPNGELATNHYPCDANAADSPCCDAGYTCLGKNLCLGPNKDTIRGSCTEKNWTPNKAGGLCNRWCFGDGGAPGATLIRCPEYNENESGADWCCENTALAGSQWYWMDWSVMQPVAVFDTTHKQFSQVGASLLPPSASKSSGGANSSPSATGGTNSGDKASTLVTTAQETVYKTVGSVIPGASETGRPSTGSSTEEAGLSTAAFAGIGAGVGVLVLIIALLVFWLWKRNKRANEERLVRAELDSDHEQGNNSEKGQLFEIATPEKSEKGKLHELSTIPHYELYGSAPPAPIHPWNSPGWNRKELPTDLERSEMDAGYYACAELSDSGSWTASRTETLQGSLKGGV